MEHTQRVQIISFGYGHAAPPRADITLDLRHHFRDPHVSPRMRDMTARDREVRDAVMNTPGIGPLVASTARLVVAYLSGPAVLEVTVAIGCAGGRHRAPTVAMHVRARLDSMVYFPVQLSHRDLDKGVIAR